MTLEATRRCFRVEAGPELIYDPVAKVPSNATITFAWRSDLSAVTKATCSYIMDGVDIADSDYTYTIGQPIMYVIMSAHAQRDFGIWNSIKKYMQLPPPTLAAKRAVGAPRVENCMWHVSIDGQYYTAD